MVLVLADFVVPYNVSPSETAEVTEEAQRAAEIQALRGFSVSSVVGKGTTKSVRIRHGFRNRHIHKKYYSQELIQIETGLMKMSQTE